MILVLCVMLAVLPTEAWKWTELHEIRVSPGDQIACKLWGLQRHWLLASDKPGFFFQTVFENNGDKLYNRRQCEIAEMHYMNMVGFDFDHCWNYGPGPNGKEAVERARRVVGKPVYYHMLTCNCEHYVKSWAGANFNWNQSGSRASKWCAIW